MHVSEIRINQIRVNQGLGVFTRAIKDLKQFLINPHYIQKGMEACSHCGMEVLVNRAIFKPCHSLPNDHQLVFVCHHHHRQFR